MKTIEALKAIEWTSPLNKLDLSYSKVGDRDGWYQISSELFISTISHDPKSGNYRPDPAGPFIVEIIWTQCKETIFCLMGETDTVNCKNPVPAPAPAQLLPPGSNGTYLSIVNALGLNNFWDQSTYTNENKFRYRTIGTSDSTYTYYFSSELIRDAELPFAVTYLLERGRTNAI